MAISVSFHVVKVCVCWFKSLLEPENVLLDGAMKIKLIDFGVARISNHTIQGQPASGTQKFMAPESFAENIFSRKSDVFSFGLLSWLIWTQNSFGLPINSCNSKRPKVRRF